MPLLAFKFQDRYEYDKEKQTAMGSWDRELKQILTNQSKTGSKQILTKQKKKTPNKIITNQKKEENNKAITYEQFKKIINSEILQKNSLIHY